MAKIYSFILLSFLSINVIVGQVKTSDYLEKIFRDNTDSVFREVLNDSKKYRVQIIYTAIDRDKENKPSFVDYYFNVDANAYFYPASTAKLPLSILSLEKLNKLNIKGVNRNTTMLTDSACCGQTAQYVDATAQNGRPSIGQYIKEVLLVSENVAYNRMYEFLGQEYINQTLADKGYSDTQIVHRFVPNSQEQNRNTNPVRFVDEDGTMLYSQPNVRSEWMPKAQAKIEMGKGYYDWDDNLINEPMDFGTKNRMSLENLHDMVKAVIFPDFVAKEMRFDLAEDDLFFLRQYMSQFPGETNYPKYDRESYYDSYVKYFFNKEKQLPQSVRVFNKVGWSYGFLTDASYVADFANKVEFFLSAVVYTNENEIFNDNVYEYKTIGLPFLYQLGQTIYRHELNRKRKYSPDLSQFEINYETQRIDDAPTIKDEGED